ncbi:hypothetical protein EVAR_22188_1 [Eumeta japonica]|uniref:Uncharacterized protein n=1 Tax=Eumeta variegata TaxID=151549 RepID=A0A4C1XW91_EUMVA|nr:hypothetical protein EVAR_22188_1 [Eumeta japonica]
MLSNNGSVNQTSLFALARPSADVPHSFVKPLIPFRHLFIQFMDSFPCSRRRPSRPLGQGCHRHRSIRRRPRWKARATKIDRCVLAYFIDGYIWTVIGTENRTVIEIESESESKLRARSGLESKTKSGSELRATTGSKSKAEPGSELRARPRPKSKVELE